MAAKKKEYAVECKMTGTVCVFVEATSEEDAIAQAEAANFKDSEITGWDISQVMRVDINE